MLSVALGLTAVGVLVGRSGAEPTKVAERGTPAVPAVEPGETPKPEDTKPLPKPGDRALLTVKVCPIAVMMEYGDYTTYQAALCDPGFVGYASFDSINGLTLGGCGTNNPHCVNGGNVLHAVGGDFLSAGLATAGLTTRLPADTSPKFADNVELLDSQDAWIPIPSATPRAPMHVKLLLIKLLPKDSQVHQPRIFGLGYEVATTGKPPSMSIDSREITPIAAHALNLKLGSVNYRVLTHRDTPAIR